MLFDADPSAAPAIGWWCVTDDEREVGRVTSIAWLPDGGGSLLGRWIGLAGLRREVPVGAVVRASGREARGFDLPVAVPRVPPAGPPPPPAAGGSGGLPFSTPLVAPAKPVGRPC